MNSSKKKKPIFNLSHNLLAMLYCSARVRFTNDELFYIITFFNNIFVGQITDNKRYIFVLLFSRRKLFSSKNYVFIFIQVGLLNGYMALHTNLSLKVVSIGKSLYVQFCNVGFRWLLCSYCTKHYN